MNSAILRALFLVTISDFTSIKAQKDCGVVRVPKPARGVDDDNYYGKVPWMVALEEDGKRQCGATLISAKWVTTAAHCVYRSFLNDNKKFEFNLVAGDFMAFSDDKYEQNRRAIRVVVHPEFSHVTLENDIALLELEEQFYPTNFVRPACLPDLDETPFPFTDCTFSGWGFANRNTRANKMKTFEMPVHPQKHCELIYHPHEGRMSSFDHKMMCAGKVLSRHKTCKGDSGGPLTCTRPSSGQKVLAGVVSYASTCRDENLLPVFTRVESHIGWIKNIINSEPVYNDDPCKWRGMIKINIRKDEIKNPNFGKSKYSRNRDCSWRYDLSKYKGREILIKVENFEVDVQNVDGCDRDRLSIYTGEHYDKLYGSYCGKSLDNKTIRVLNKAGRLRFHFLTDNSIHYEGFKLRFRVI